MITERHFNIIRHHVRAMLHEIAEPFLDTTVTSTRDAAKIADEHVKFTDALQEFVATLGTDQWPEIELDLLPAARR